MWRGHLHLPEGAGGSPGPSVDSVGGSGCLGSDRLRPGTACRPRIEVLAVGTSSKLETRMRSVLISLVALIAVQLSSEATAQPVLVTEVAPQGKLRVGILGYNPVLATRRPDGTISGISVSVGKFIADALGVPLEPVVYVTAESGVQSYGKGEWDVMIGPRGPAVEQQAEFGPDILLVDNIYVAAPGRDFADAGQIDKPGVRVGVVRDAVPDQFLSRNLKYAELVRVSAPIEVAVETLRSGKADVFASRDRIRSVPFCSHGSRPTEGTIARCSNEIIGDHPRGKSNRCSAKSRGGVEANGCSSGAKLIP
jgi:polar amino acid transport system substrate-binding protein